MGTKIKQMMVCAAVTIFAASGHAEVISFNLRTTATPKINTNVFTGVIGDLTWTDAVLGTLPGTFDFTDVDGSTMDASVTGPAPVGSATAWDGWASRGGIKASATVDVTVSLTQIPYDNYYIIAYVAGYATPYKGVLSDGTTTKYFDFMAVSAPSLVESLDINNLDGYDAGSYVVFGSEANPLNGSSQTLTLSSLSAASVGLGGIQVVKTEAAPVISFNLRTTATPKINTSVFTGVIGDLTWADAVLGTNSGTYNFTDMDGSTMDASVTGPAVVGSVAAWDGWASRAGIKASSTEDATVLLSQIPYTNYYIVAYVTGYGAPYKGALSNGASTKYFDFLAVSAPSLVESLDINNIDGYDAGSYVVFGSEASPLSGSSQTLTLSSLSVASVGLGGIQVVEVIVTFQPSVSIVGWSLFSTNVMRLVIDAPDQYYLKTTTDLVSGTWTNAAYSVDGSDPFLITNLVYATSEGTNKVIYVDVGDAKGFFGIGE